MKRGLLIAVLLTTATSVLSMPEGCSISVSVLNGTETVTIDGYQPAAIGDDESVLDFVCELRPTDPECQRRRPLLLDTFLCGYLIVEDEGNNEFYVGMMCGGGATNERAFTEQRAMVLDIEWSSAFASEMTFVWDDATDRGPGYKWPDEEQEIIFPIWTDDPLDVGSADGFLLGGFEWAAGTVGTVDLTIEPVTLPYVFADVAVIAQGPGRDPSPFVAIEGWSEMTWTVDCTDYSAPGDDDDGGGDGLSVVQIALIAGAAVLLVVIVIASRMYSASSSGSGSASRSSKVTRSNDRQPLQPPRKGSPRKPVADPRLPSSASSVLTRIPGDQYYSS